MTPLALHALLRHPDWATVSVLAAPDGGPAGVPVRDVLTVADLRGDVTSSRDALLAVALSGLWMTLAGFMSLYSIPRSCRYSSAARISCPNPSTCSSGSRVSPSAAAERISCNDCPVRNSITM